MAREIAACVHYAPHGRRGYAAPIVRASGFGAWSSYAVDAVSEVLLAVQIEHVDAVPDVAEIAAIPGIDMIFIGPNDLASSMGFIERLEQAEVKAMIGRIETATSGASSMLGTIEGNGRDAGDLKRDGYQLIVGPNDVSLLAMSARESANRTKMLLEK